MGRDAIESEKVNFDRWRKSLMQIWLDDKLVDAAIAEVDFDGWPNGEGVFETIRTKDAQVFELGRHMRRALKAARALSITLPTEEVVFTAVKELLDAQPHPSGRLRLFFSANRFVAVHQLYVEVTEPARLMVLTDSFPVSPITHKTFPYQHRLALLAMATQQGFDEIICCNDDGEVSEGAVSNYLFRIQGKWVTTPLTAGVLPGIQRGIAIERCGVSVQKIMRSEIESIDAAFVISSLKIALPVASIDGKSLKIDQDCKNLAANIWAKTESHSVG